MDNVMEHITQSMYRFADFVQLPATREAFHLHLRGCARILTATLAAVYLLLACSLFFVQSPSTNLIVADNPNFYVDTDSGRIKDNFGRERIFHGVNVVFKGEPWLPRTDKFDPHMSFSDEDVEILKTLGLNVIRLGVMWPGVFPESKDQANQTYLEEVRKIVHKLHDAGIYTLVDFHQDVFGSQFCGEGVPDWLLESLPFSDPQVHQQLAGQSQRKLSEGKVPKGAGGNDTLKDVPCVGYAVCMKPKEYAKSFPEPVSPSFFSRPASNPGDSGEFGPDMARASNGETGAMLEKFYAQVRSKQEKKRELLALRQSVPSDSQCRSVEWGIYHFSFAVSRAFQDLYENRWGWRDRLAEFWTSVAGVLKGEDGVLGFDLINEPWVGDIFYNPLLMAPGVADRLNYAPLYEHLQEDIRKVDASRLLFFEGTTFDDVASGFTQVPGGQGYANMSIISYHYYRPPNVAPRAAFLQHDAERKRLKCGWMLTEFGIPNRRPDWVNARAGSQEPATRLNFDGELKEGVACLPVGKAGENVEPLADRCSRSSSRCAAGSARSWKEFVEAWAKVANSSSMQQGKSVSAHLSDCSNHARKSGQGGVHLQAHDAARGETVATSVFAIPQTARVALPDGEGHVGHPVPRSEDRSVQAMEPVSNLAAKVTEKVSSARGARSLLDGRGGSIEMPLTHPAGSSLNPPKKHLPKALQMLEDFRPLSSPPAQLQQATGYSNTGSGKPLKQGPSKVVPGSLDEMRETLDLADEHAQSWMAWEYKSYLPITGANYGLFSADGGLNQLIVQFFWRTYPIAVAGSIQSFSFDSYKSSFTMAYKAAASTPAQGHGKQARVGTFRGRFNLAMEGLAQKISPFQAALSPGSWRRLSSESLERATDISVCCNAEMNVEVEPAGIKVEWLEERRVVRLHHGTKHEGLEVHVRISPKAQFQPSLHQQ